MKDIIFRHLDWEGFENLIREVFEQAYAGPGGEVKITQASRDSGMIYGIFNPNPLRGGKTVATSQTIYQCQLSNISSTRCLWYFNK